MGCFRLKTKRHVAAHYWRRAMFLPLLVLAACSGPKMDATRTLGRGVTIENTDAGAFRIDRIIANGSPENTNCNNYPGRTLAPGETYTTVLWLCGTITRVDVVTDKGTASLTWN